MSDISIISKEQCELGEGPFFCSRRQTLFWFDIVGMKQHSVNMKTYAASSIALPLIVSAMSVTDDETDVFFTEAGLWLHDLNQDNCVMLASIEQDNSSTRSNDARVHPSGAYWLGTMGKNAEFQAGSIYYFRKGRLETLFENISIPNAICFTPDGRTGYFTDTLSGKLMRVAVDPDTGFPDAEPEVFIDHQGQQGGLDGAIIDGDGNIWIALWGASCMNCYDPAGHLLTSITLPALQPSCPVFVADNKIAVTSAWQGMGEGARKVDLNAGNTFLVSTSAKAHYDYKVII